MIRSIQAATAALTLLLFTPTAHAQSHCPHTRAEQYVSTLTLHGTISCSGGVRVVLNEIEFVGGSDGVCPRIAIVPPSYAREVSSPGSYTYADYHSTLAALVIEFECKGDYFLFIRLASHCVGKKQTASGGFNHYVTRRCTALIAN